MPVAVPVAFWDFDGTLLNTIDGIVASYIYTWQTVSGRQVVRSEILPWIGRIRDHQMMRGR